MVSLAQVPPPEILLGDRPPEPTLDEYRHRLAAASAAIAARGLDFLVVYGDREYFGDIYHLTGLDPRFEEGILVLDTAGAATMFLGNENLPIGPVRQIGISIELFQELSPQGQRRDQPVTLTKLLQGTGIAPGSHVGLSGQKAASPHFFELSQPPLSAPAYLVDTLRHLVGPNGSVHDAKSIFLDPDTGLRARSSVHDIARFEYGASVASAAVFEVLRHVRPGKRADELSDLVKVHGLPYTCHPMINFGTRTGLYSPAPEEVRLGQAFQIAIGVRGGLTCRAGAVASGPQDLEPGLREFFPELAKNYFDVITTWHENVAVGADTGAVFAAVDAVRDDELFEFSLNPGHFLHYEEWSASTFWHGEQHQLRSGAMVQGDVIPVVAYADCQMNIEDGLALADADLRTQIADSYPDLWDRIQRRRAFMSEQLGVVLDESALPMSVIPLWHTPYALAQNLVLTR